MTATNQLTSNFTLKVSIPENVLAQELNGEVVLLNMENEAYYSLNPVGSQIWQLLTEQGDVETAMQQLLQIYVLDETTQRKDVTILINELLEVNLLQKTEEQKVGKIEKQPIESYNNIRLSYEPPKLRKHGTIHDVTLATTGGSRDDGFNGGAPFYTDS